MHCKCCLFLSILSLVRAEVLKISGYVGHNVTLPCAYDGQTHGLVSFCWSRGKVPSFVCSNSIVYAKNGVLSYLEEPRYQLLGRLSDGDVSLTILNAQPDDAGVYGCRVELPGWFNDYKVSIYLVVEEVFLEQSVSQVGVVSLPATVGKQATPDVSGFEHAEDYSTLNNKSRTEDTFRVEVGNICRVTAIVSLTVLIIIVFIPSARRPRPTQHLKTSTVENIYEMV
ncbi:hepatitis A virus cellular receptor 1-like isoform X2 [Corythoichthys intestinalis]|uniref:hepatitis A virus cellular receptor 1-like isoform X2 n=1 Tax=Corythoichthys intestinalis TaxID=161448 RepID=UPI0025A66C0F|nr:hepatitis A virus cellular receptor 1-like isoform X2 [Corythoichthys intestinalis]